MLEFKKETPFLVSVKMYFVMSQVTTAMIEPMISLMTTLTKLYFSFSNSFVGGLPFSRGDFELVEVGAQPITCFNGSWCT